MIRHILAAVDFSDTSSAALDEARELARSLSAHLTILHADEFPVMRAGELYYLPAAVIEEHEAALRERLALLAELARADGIEVSSKVVPGPPHKVILEVANSVEANLIVMGTHGGSGLRRVLAGSVAERVVRTSPIPVLTVRCHLERERQPHTAEKEH